MVDSRFASKMEESGDVVSVGFEVVDSRSSSKIEEPEDVVFVWFVEEDELLSKVTESCSRIV